MNTFQPSRDPSTGWHRRCRRNGTANQYLDLCWDEMCLGIQFTREQVFDSGLRTTIKDECCCPAVATQLDTKPGANMVHKSNRPHLGVQNTKGVCLPKKMTITGQIPANQRLLWDTTSGQLFGTAVYPCTEGASIVPKPCAMLK